MFSVDLLFFAVALVVLVLNILVRIPAYHYGVPEFFGGRSSKRVLYEGPRLKLPGEKVKLISMALAQIPFEITFTTKDKLQVRCAGSLQYRPDPRVFDKEGRNLFISMSPEIITTGITDTIQTKLGALGGIKESDEFIENRQAITDFLNTFFRLGIQPHSIHDPDTCDIEDCKLSKGPIDAEDILDFYKDHWRSVKPLLDNEQKDQDDQSSFEKRYGIDVDLLTLPEVDFTEKIKETFEEEKQIEVKGRAFDTKIEMVKKVKELGATNQEALNTVDASLDLANKEVISVEGDIATGFIGKILSSKGG